MVMLVPPLSGVLLIGSSGVGWAALGLAHATGAVNGGTPFYQSLLLVTAPVFASYVVGRLGIMWGQRHRAKKQARNDTALADNDHSRVDDITALRDKITSLKAEIVELKPLAEQVPSLKADLKEVRARNDRLLDSNNELRDRNIELTDRIDTVTDARNALNEQMLLLQTQAATAMKTGVPNE